MEKIKKDLRILRIDKIKSIISMVSGQGEKTSYKKIIAEFCLQEGLSKRTVKEYIDLLIDSGQIIKIGDDLSPSSTFLLDPIFL